MLNIKQFIKQCYRYSRFNNILEMAKIVCAYDIRLSDYDLYSKYRNIFRSGNKVPYFIFESAMRGDIAFGIVEKAILHPQLPTLLRNKNQVLFDSIMI